MWQRECLPPKTLIPPRRLHRIRGRYAALSTLVRRAYIQRRTGTGQLLFPFSKYAPVTIRFPVYKPATIKLTHYPRGVAALYLEKQEGKELVYMGKVGTGWSRTVSSQIRKQLDTVVSPKSKLTKPVPKPKATWVEPKFYADVEYREHLGRPPSCKLL
jgi:ATP dependent DNA ligase C terminal region